MLWSPEKEWLGQDAFIIGGGSSLKGFDFSKLQGANTIGCNDAFRLGSEITKICIFGDASYFHRVGRELAEFKGRVVTCAPAIQAMKAPWLLTMNRVRDSLQAGNVLGWNYSTGAAAVNLAISLGADKIYLLGFDMTGGPDGKTHWHNYRTKQTSHAAFDRFVKGFQTLKYAIDKLASGIEVLNVTDGSSKLPVFDRITMEEMFRRKR